MFYDKYAALCIEKEISPSKAATEIGLNKASVTNWKKNGYTPRTEVLQRIADYFEVPLDFLLDRPPFDCWDLINQNRKGFLHYVDIDSNMLPLVWGIDPKNPDAVPMKDFISFLSLVVETARPTSEGDWDVTLRPNFKKEKTPTQEGERKHKLKSISRLEDADITEEEDSQINDLIAWYLKSKGKDT